MVGKHDLQQMSMFLRGQVRILAQEIRIEIVSILFSLFHDFVELERIKKVICERNKKLRSSGYPYHTLN